MTKGSAGQRELRYLSTALALEETLPPVLVRTTPIIGALVVVAALAWSAVAKLPQTAPAAGQIIPAGSTIAVQHLEGGIVAEIAVGEGMLVQEGARLVLLDSTAADSELAQARAREAALAGQVARLRAFAEGRALDDGVEPRADDQALILAMQEKSRASQRRVLEQQLAARRAELAAAEAQVQAVERQIAPIEAVLGIREKLLEAGYASRIAVFDGQRELARTQGELAQLQGAVRRLQEGVGEAEGRLLELDSRLDSDALVEMGRLQGELAQVRETIAKLEDRVRRVDIRAPTRGVVKEMRVRSLGAVIAPGGPVAEIVPVGKELVAETRLSPRDVGQVAAGQPVKLRVSAYDPARYGTVDGHLRAVSAATFQEADGKPYYKATIALARPYMGDDPAANPLLPGMVVTAEISTGERSVLQYFAGSVSNALRSGLHER
jgi:membrane fusion protein, adhesin transport system